MLPSFPFQHCLPRGRFVRTHANGGLTFHARVVLDFFLLRKYAPGAANDEKELEAQPGIDQDGF